MTDHSSGSDERDDDYRLAAGTPQDAPPQAATPFDAPVAAPGTGERGADASGADGPPPQLSGQPGWAYSPTELATPQVPQAQQGGAAAQGAGQVPGGIPAQAGADGGYGYPQQQPFAAAPTQGYAYPGTPPQSDVQAQAQSYGFPPAAQPMPGQVQQPMPPVPGQPYGQSPYGAQSFPQPFPQQFPQPGAEQAPYGQQPLEQPYGQQPYGQAGFEQPGMAPQPEGQGPWPQMPPLPTEGQPQPGYPYPGYQQPSPPRNGLSKGAIGGIVAGGVVLAIVAVAAIALTSNGGGGGGGSSVRTLASGWSVPGTVSENQVGTWVTDTYFVRASSAGVQAYNLTDGTPAWSARPLSGPSTPCAMSPTVSPSGIGTIGFGPDFSNCTTLVGVDTHTGKTLWSTSLTTSDHTAPTAVSTFIDGQVGVIVNDNVLGGVNLTDGHVVWGYKARGQYCNAYPYGGVGTVLVDDYCADVNPSYVVTALDAATGKQLWQKPGSDHVEFGGVLDSSPLIAIVNGTGGSSAVNRYDSGGNATALTLKETIETTSSGMGVSSADAGAQTVGSTLVFPSRPSEEKQDITGINPTTGATLWTYDGETHGGAALMHPAQSASGAGAGKVYAISFVNGYGTGAGPEVVAIDAATGKSTVIAKLPANPDSLVYSSGSVYLLPDGRVLLASADASGTAVRLFK